MEERKFMWFIFLVVMMVLSFAMLHYDEMSRTIILEKAAYIANHGATGK